MHQVPWLRSGVGQTPKDGGCILQVIDWLDHEGWTDKPQCVHPVFQKLAIYVNDKLPDKERQKLLDLTGRLMGTNTGGKEMSVRLAAFVARGVLHIYEEKHPNDRRPRAAIESAEKWDNEPTEKNAAYATDAASDAYDASDAAYAAADAAYAAYAASDAAYADVYQLLLDTLDEYDRLSGRTHTDPVDLSPVAEMLALVGVTPDTSRLP